MMKPFHKRAGFTLIELVVSLLLIAILSTAFIPFIQMSQQRSAETLLSAGRMYALQNQMEILVAAYAAEIYGGGDVVSFQPQVTALLNDGITLEANDFVKEKDGGLVADDKDVLLLVSIRDNSGYRLRRLFSAK